MIRAALPASLLLVAVYRAWVVRPLWLDGYLLYLPGWVFAPLLLVLLYRCRKGTRKDFVVMIAAAVLWLGFIWPLRWHFARSSPAPIRLVTLNIQSYRTDLVPAASRAALSNPDFICLQEVWKVEHLQTLQASLPGYKLHSHPREKEEEDGFYDFGTFVAVREDWEGRALESPESTARVEVERQGLRLTVVSFHGRKLAGRYNPSSLLQTLELQREQMQELERLADGSNAPLLVGGDFNALPCGPAFKVFPLRSAFSQVGRGFGSTFPSNFPCLQLDQVLGSSEVGFVGLDSFDAGSDHLALEALLVIAEE